MLKKVLIIGILSALTTSSYGEEENIPPALQAQILLLSVLKGADPARLAVYAKVNSLRLHDAITASVIRKMRNNSGQSLEDFAATIEVPIDELQGFETEGIGVNREMMEKMWSISPLSIRELSELRGEIISTELTPDEMQLISQRGINLTTTLLALRFAQKVMKEGETLSVEVIMRKIKNNHAAIEEFMRETLAENQEIISADAITNELVQTLVDISAAADAIQEHAGFRFLQDKILELRKVALSNQKTNP